MEIMGQQKQCVLSNKMTPTQIEQTIKLAKNKVESRLYSIGFANV